jgi:hypothetical protein
MTTSARATPSSAYRRTAASLPDPSPSRRAARAIVEGAAIRSAVYPWFLSSVRQAMVHAVPPRMSIGTDGIAHQGNFESPTWPADSAAPATSQPPKNNATPPKKSAASCRRGKRTSSDVSDRELRGCTTASVRVLPTCRYGSVTPSSDADSSKSASRKAYSADSYAQTSRRASRNKRSDRAKRSISGHNVSP